MISEIEQQSLDIDWFFSDANNIAFVASGGGKLPKSIEKSKNYEILVLYFRNLPDISEIKLNEDLDKILKSKPDERYLNDFITMARKGLYAFDKTVLNNFKDTNYHLVAFPVKPLSFSDLSQEIKSKLKETIINQKLYEIVNINSLEIS
ncbi:hypothetical protein CFS9_40280 [Flavobacterium sp. CFS9]|uniref:Uncharacterized protein n=1 Tax=Flavobacterium sp. CFS9 TaxID=3143118 RepID=A0AAT9H7C6_9FLAO